ncbi:vWA domain-containing protein [Nocardia crassostreae]|uniref:vWA domain-containing protein n=1 Tax=Nocardia crassostreae TaxID=53428 RepID=UPI001470DEA2|nr:VWA domain-containing protein [Nocardia crassostreae]
MLVLDGSGSMLAEDPGGGTKMDAAKSAVRTFVAGAPGESKVGLTVYGTGTGSSEAEKVAGCGVRGAGCGDVSVLQQAETLDRGALTSAVEGVTPRGFTPIGTALRTAAEALPKEGARSIVLVSDGEDTCAPPDPCEVARELKAEGTELVVHAIGFGVDEQSRVQLTCLAQATGGTYTDAADGKTLEQVLPRISAAALRNYEATGTPISGTANYVDAPVVTEPGQYLDTIGQEEKRFYGVDVPAGATAYFTAALSFPRRNDVGILKDLNRLELRAYGKNGEDCNKYESEFVTRSSDGEALTATLVFAGAAETSGPPGCSGGGRYYFTAQWAQASDGALERMPMELVIGIEPALAGSGGPEEVGALPEYTTPTTPAVPVVGGGSFTVAAALPGSGVYTDALQYGELVFYKVKLDWGQALAYRVHYDAIGRSGLEAIANVDTAIYSPLLDEVESDTHAYTGNELVLPASKALSTYPIRYHNRDGDVYEARDQALAGWYYIAVKLGLPREESDVPPVPIRLELQVVGEPEPGPVYAQTTANSNTLSGDDGAGKPVQTTAAESTVSSAGV